MNWNSKDIPIFQEQKEFVDTVIIPLLLVDGRADQIKHSAGTAEFLMMITSFMENQFKGRVVLMPPVSYTIQVNRKELGKEWKDVLKEAGFKHQFFVSSDALWVTEASDLEVIFTPSIPLEHMDQKLRQSVLDDQLRQVIPIFANRWAKTSS
jgi:hypothetical protein